MEALSWGDLPVREGANPLPLSPGVGNMQGLIEIHEHIDIIIPPFFQAIVIALLVFNCFLLTMLVWGESIENRAVKRLLDAWRGFRNRRNNDNKDKDQSAEGGAR